MLLVTSEKGREVSHQKDRIEDRKHGHGNLIDEVVGVSAIFFRTNNTAPSCCEYHKDILNQDSENE